MKKQRFGMTVALLIIGILMFGSFLVFAQTRRSNSVPLHLIETNIRVGDISRTYYLFVPENAKETRLPLLFVFHGGGGNPLSMDRRLGLRSLRERRISLSFIQKVLAETGMTVGKQIRQERTEKRPTT